MGVVGLADPAPACPFWRDVAIRNSPELDTAYTDTLLDLALGLSGSVTAAILATTVLWPRRAPTGTPV